MLVQLDVAHEMCSKAVINHIQMQLIISVWPRENKIIQNHHEPFIANTDKQIAYLCNNKHVGPLDNTFCNFTTDRFSNRIFIFVCPSSVYMAVTNINSVLNGFFYFTPIWLQGKQTCQSTFAFSFYERNKSLTAQVPKPRAGIRLPSLNWTNGVFDISISLFNCMFCENKLIFINCNRKLRLIGLRVEIKPTNNVKNDNTNVFIQWRAWFIKCKRKPESWFLGFSTLSLSLLNRFIAKYTCIHDVTHAMTRWERWNERMLLQKFLF